MKDRFFASAGPLLVSGALLGLEGAFACISAAEPALITSSPQPSLSASGDSALLNLTRHGRYVVFCSEAPNILAGPDRAQGLDLYRHDLMTGQTLLLARDVIDAVDASDDAGIVVFTRRTSGSHPDELERLRSHVFAWRELQGDVIPVDLDAGGATPIGLRNPPLSERPLVSAEGHRVAYESRATNLVEGMVLTEEFGTNPVVSIYIRDLEAGTNQLVSVSVSGDASANESSRLQAMTPDGRHVVFTSRATNLVEEVVDGREHVYVHDSATGETFAASPGADPSLASPEGWSFVDPLLSDDGRYVAYKAEVPQSTPPVVVAHVFQLDRVSGTTTHIATNAAAGAVLTMSANGAIVAFESVELGGQRQVRVWDRGAGTHQIASVNMSDTGPGNGPSRQPCLSADGTALVFASRADDLTSEPGNGRDQLFWRHLPTGACRLITRSVGGGATNGKHLWSGIALNTNGHRVVFDSAASDLAAGDLNHARDVWVWESDTDLLQLVSLADAARLDRTAFGWARLWSGSASADLQRMAFTSRDGLYVQDDTNEVDDLFLWRAETGMAEPIGMQPPPVSGSGLTARRPVLSANGDTLAFTRYRKHPDISRLLSNPGLWIWTTSGGLVEVSPPALYDEGAFSTWNPGAGPIDPARGLSPDGSRLAYFSDWNGSSPMDLVLYHTLTGESELVDRFIPEGSERQLPFFSADNQWLVAGSRDANNQFYEIVAYRLPDLSPQLIVTAPWSLCYGATMSADSSTLAYIVQTNQPSQELLMVHDMATGTKRLAAQFSQFQDQSLSANGQVLCFTTYPHPGSGAFPDHRLQVVDLSTGLAEQPPPTGDGGWEPSFYTGGAVLSGDGRFVVFAQGHMSTVRARDTFLQQVLAWDRWLDQTMVVSLNREGTAPGNGPSHQPIMSADGRHVLFHSYANDLISRDEGRSRDVFILELTGEDTDGDQMEDAWEMAFFDTLDRDGTGDADGDGLTDADEYRTGTDPTNEGSVLRVLALSALGDGDVKLIWSAEPGRPYRVQYKEEAGTPGWTDLPGDIVSRGGQATKIDDTAGASMKRFYRVTLVAP